MGYEAQTSTTSREITLSASRFGRVQKTVAVVPLALLSAAWTASLTSAATPSANLSSVAAEPGGLLPDGSSVPLEAIEAPASVTGDGDITGSIGGVEGDVQQIVATSSTNGIPSAALAAYQRAETVINAADESCNLTWQLVAAIGRVESNHGRFGGNVLDADGLAKPGILGPALDGTGKFALISDTDAGQYDNDTRFDRAVGPMQFIPSTWSVVGVDGDSDGTRNPQDVDDAALATAVYLCSGDDDLSAEKGQRASVYRYNHSNDYVDLVLDIMRAYQDGDFSAVPTSTLTSGVIMPDTTTGPSGTKGGKGGKGTDGGKGGKGGKTPTPTAKPTPTATPTSEPTQNPTQTPTQTPTKNPTNEPTSVPTTVATTLPTLDPTSIPTLPLPTDPIGETLTLTQALAQCTQNGVIDNPLTATNELLDCANGLLNP